MSGANIPNVCLQDVQPERASGSVRVEHFTVTPDDEKRNVRGFFRPMEYVPPGRYVRLMRGGSVWMSDTPMERRSNYEVISKATGDVLIGGLGLGMIVHPIASKPSVRSVTVVEIDPDVVTCVGPSVEANPKVRVILADVMTWDPPKGAKYQAIYFDIWRDICTDNLDDMARLNRRYAKHFDKAAPGAWRDQWMRDHLLGQRRREKREWWSR